MTKLFLGGAIDPATGDRKDKQIQYDGDDLTTHGVIVGMTGSGKTGLGVIMLEELLRGGTPALIIDPKGDMGNLLLNFPDLAPQDFEPWIGDRVEDGTTAGEVAAKTAAMWKDGLASWGLGSDQMRSLLGSVDMTVYTPGSTAGTPLNVLGSFAAPDIDWETGAENARAEIEGLISGLLSLVNVEADPLTSREHILLSNLVERAWRNGKDLDLATLIQQVMAPPLRKLGVFELDAFFPEKDRHGFALKLNGLLANPAFASWISGEPVDVERLLWNADGKPKASIVYIAHLTPSERQFVVALLLSKVATWMQTKSGATKLRAAVYMDEVFGFVPPTATPPSKKPILTLLKQARAFGVGLILSTQNPVDLDYKAMSNAGTWMIGRLQTERDKTRILEALQSASGAADVKELDKTLSGLGKRQFLLHSTRSNTPDVFTTRWAMSYLAGPLTKSQLTTLEKTDSSVATRAQAPQAPAQTATAPAAGGPPPGTGLSAPPPPATASAPPPATASAPPPPAAPATTAPTAAAAQPTADDESAVPPKIADGVPVFFLDPGAPWLGEVNADADSSRYEVGLSARVRLKFDERKAKLDHALEWEAVFTDLGRAFDPNEAIVVDYDNRDFRDEAPGTPRYVLSDAPIHTKQFFRETTRSIKDYLLREKELNLFCNPELKLYSFVGETQEQFEARCAKVAEEHADKKTAKLRTKLERKVRSLKRKLDTAERRISDAKDRVKDSKRDELVSGAGSVFGVLLGRRSTKAIAKGAAGKVRGMSSRRSRTARLEGKIDNLEAKMEDVQEEINELEQDTIDEVTQINDEWTDKAESIEDFQVGLEKNDISIEQLAVIWIPR